MLNIQNCLARLKKERQIFVSEADFQLELAWVLKDEYPSAKVRCEYTPTFNPRMHIDILAIMDNKWIPIELKYRTKGCIKKHDGDEYNIKNHSAKDQGCYDYLKDIQRIERARKEMSSSEEVFFEEGYAIFITNDKGFQNPPKDNCKYKEYSLADGLTKHGKMEWDPETGEGTKKGREDPIELKGSYPINWAEYSKIDDSNTGTFWCLVNQIIG